MFEHREEVFDLVSERLSTDTTDHWLALMLAHDVWTAPVQDYDQLMRDPQMLHNRLMWDVPVGPSTDGEAPTFRTVGSPFTFSRTPTWVRRGVPRLGQHTAEVMGPGPDA